MWVRTNEGKTGTLPINTKFLNWQKSYSHRKQLFPQRHVDSDEKNKQTNK
jgi:hypothetical protein